MPNRSVQLPFRTAEIMWLKGQFGSGGTGCPSYRRGLPLGVMVFALPENSVIKMKFCGLLARGQKPRHRDTRQLHIPPAVRCKGKPRLHNIQNNDLYVITENLLEPFIQTTFKVNNSVVYEKNKLTNYAWKTVDKGNPFSIMLKKENGFTPMISLILQ